MDPKLRSELKAAIRPEIQAIVERDVSKMIQKEGKTHLEIIERAIVRVRKNFQPKSDRDRVILETLHEVLQELRLKAMH